MTRTKATILITLVFILALGLSIGSYYYFYDELATTSEDGRTGFRSFFPFGGTSGGEDDDKRDGTAGDVEETRAPTLRQIGREPVAGAFLFSKDENGKKIDYVRYVQRATGHIYETKLAFLGTNRISNTTLPKIVEAKWLSPESVLLRYLSDDNETIITFLAELTGVSTSTEGILEYKIDGDFLSEDIYDVTASSDGNIFYLKKENSSVVGTKIDGKTGRLTDIFTSPITEWLSHWMAARTVWLTTKASYASLGYTYALNSDSGSTQKILGNLSGLSILPNYDSTKFIYSYISSGLPTFRFFDMGTGSSDEIYLSGLADKCAWSKRDTNIAYCAVPTEIKNSTLPDSWYEGSYSFNDNIWKIEAESGSTEFMITPSDEAGEDIDAFNLLVSPDGEYLVFQNKNDLTLWSLYLSGVLPGPEEN